MRHIFSKILSHSIHTQFYFVSQIQTKISSLCEVFCVCVCLFVFFKLFDLLFIYAVGCLGWISGSHTCGAQLIHIPSPYKSPYREK